MRPHPIIGMRRRLRTSGEQYLHATIGEDLHVPAGSTFDLRRIAPDEADGPTFALLIVPPPPRKPGRNEGIPVGADRLDGSVLRRDHRDQHRAHTDAALEAAGSTIASADLSVHGRDDRARPFPTIAALA
jgi:hypothetical protein